MPKLWVVQYRRQHRHTTTRPILASSSTSFFRFLCATISHTTSMPCSPAASCHNNTISYSSTVLLRLFHTADTDKTRLSHLVLSVSAVWNELTSSQDCRQQKISKLNMFSFLQSCPVSKCGVNWVLSCLDSVSNLQLGLWRHTHVQVK